MSTGLNNLCRRKEGEGEGEGKEEGGGGGGGGGVGVGRGVVRVPIRTPRHNGKACVCVASVLPPALYCSERNAGN